MPEQYTLTTQELYRKVADYGCQYVAGMLSAICVLQGRQAAIEYARIMGLPIEVPLYAVRMAR